MKKKCTWKSLHSVEDDIKLDLSAEVVIKSQKCTVYSVCNACKWMRSDFEIDHGVRCALVRQSLFVFCNNIGLPIFWDSKKQQPQQYIRHIPSIQRCYAFTVSPIAYVKYIHIPAIFGCLSGNVIVDVAAAVAVAVALAMPIRCAWLCVVCASDHSHPTKWFGVAYLKNVNIN